MIEGFWLAAAALVGGAAISWAGVSGARAWALKKSILDSPNERSSHVRPTPRGGGLGLVAGLGAALAAGYASGATPGWALEAYLLALPIAWIGWQDDKRGLSARARLAAQLALGAIWIAYSAWQFAPFPPVWLAGGLEISPPFAWAFLALFIAWMANLHNFMDGIDGLAAVQAISIGLGAALIARIDRVAVPAGANGAESSEFVWLALAAASVGFLVWNWSPAKIFMGDVGSAFIGFFVACLAVRWEAQRPGALALIAVLDAVFIVDATWTLAVRAWRGDRLSQAHRSHAYQIASRRLGSHAKPVAIVLVYNLAVLIPLAALSASGRLAPLAAFAVGAMGPAAACLWLKAGHRPVA